MRGLQSVTLKNVALEVIKNTKNSLYKIFSLKTF